MIRRLLPFTVAAAAAALGAGWLPWSHVATVARGPMSLALPVFLAIAVGAGLAERRSRRSAEAPAAAYPVVHAVAVSVDIPRQRAAAAEESLPVQPGLLVRR